MPQSQAEMTIAVRSAGPSDEARAIGVLVLAFSADPVTRWSWPDPLDYLAHFPAFAKAFGGAAFVRETAFIAEDGGGCALWLPPGVQPDEDALVGLLQRTVGGQKMQDVFAVLEQMGRHHPGEPHWYLPLMGVDPSQQGRGQGSALLQRALAVCDRDNTLAYLESTNPRNVPLYRRHGFELLGTIQAGSSPPLFAMLRRPAAKRA